MYSHRSFWRNRNFFQEDESDNLFYNFTPDHRTDYLWDDEALEAVIAEQFGTRSEVYSQLHSLTERGYLEILRRLAQAGTPYLEKKRMLEQIETAIRADKKNREGMLKHLRSFCDAIGYYSEEDKEADRKRTRMRSLAVLLSVLCSTALLGFLIVAVKNPLQYFPVRHMYITASFGRKKLIDVSYQLNQLTGIAFYDNGENLKTELSADNSWGQYNLCVNEPAANGVGARKVFFWGGSAVPEGITESNGEEEFRSINYNPSGLISSIHDIKGDDDILESFRNINYSEDGITTTIEVTNFKEYRYYNALLEPIYYYKEIREEEGNEYDNQTVYRDSEDRIIGIEEIKTLYNYEGAIRIIKYTLGDGTIQNYYAYVSASSGQHYIYFPLEEIFTAHPESEKEYKDGRLVRETWGPLQGCLKRYFEYVYDQDRLVNIFEYMVPYDSGEPVCCQKYVINEQGHISEILPQEYLFAPYDLSIEYDEESRIKKVQQYQTVYGERVLVLTNSCEYRDDGSLACIHVNNGEERLVDLLVDPDGEIVNYIVPDLED